MKKRFKTTVPLIAPNKRLNPQMLRILLSYLIKSRFDGVLANAYNSLKTSRSRFNPKNKRRLVPFNKNTLREVLNDERQITYIMLESFADEAGVPTWLLLLFSRTLSDDIDSRKKPPRISEADLAATEINIKRTIAFLEIIGDRLKEKEGPMSVDMIDEWIDLYKDGAETDQQTLFD